MRNYLGIGTCFLVVLLPWAWGCSKDCSEMAVPVKTTSPCQKGKLAQLLKRYLFSS